MIVYADIKGNEAVVIYEFSDEDLSILHHLKEHGYMEFRNGHNSEIVDKLYDNGFVTSDDSAWHFTVVLTKLGEAVVKNLDKN